MSRTPINLFISLIAVLFISGCGANKSFQGMKQAKAAYKACVAENPKDPAACKREKEDYEAAGDDYNSLAPDSAQP